jgi:hypothetical protein
LPEMIYWNPVMQAPSQYTLGCLIIQGQSHIRPGTIAGKRLQTALYT